MVGGQSLPCEWAPHSELPTTSGNSIRRLQLRVGSCKQWGSYQVDMETRRIQPPHQLQGALGSILCGESLHQTTSECPCINSHRQHHNNSLYQQNEEERWGGESLSRLSKEHSFTSCLFVSVFREPIKNRLGCPVVLRYFVIKTRLVFLVLCLSLVVSVNICNR